MKCRREPAGYHYYDRATGFHLLVDEVQPAPDEWALYPSTLSIALTNACQLACPFCYAPKSRAELDARDVLSWALEAAELGALDVAFGGGEPLLHPHLVELCQRVWSETDLGISITTNGHALSTELVDKLAGSVGFVRVSIDGPEPLYSRLRGRSLRELLWSLAALKDAIPFGINVVVWSLTLPGLDRLLELAQEAGAKQMLLLPLIRDGGMALSVGEWEQLGDWVRAHWRAFPLAISADALGHVEAPLLFEHADPNSFAHITAEGYLRRRSYGLHDGVAIRRYGSLKASLRSDEWRASGCTFE